MSADGSPGLEFNDAPVLARAAAGVWWRAARWGMGASARAGAQVVRAAAEPVLTVEAVSVLGDQLRTYARDLLGISALDAQVRQLMPPANGAGGRSSTNGSSPEHEGLRIQGALLLRAAADVNPDHRAHPAYARILTELAPDEARILRLMATDGAQPSVDVRAANLIGIGTDLVAGGLNMIGAQAGVADRDRIPAYLNNLERLGLVWFSREPIDDAIAYQVLEAQPEVMEALKRAPRAKNIQRSIHLTPFGEDFCRVCLPLDTEEMEDLSEPPPADH
jgi:Abortive infection alpha